MKPLCFLRPFKIIILDTLSCLLPSQQLPTAILKIHIYLQCCQLSPTISGPTHLEILPRGEKFQPVNKKMAKYHKYLPRNYEACMFLILILF
jgi:hypothetical protein